MHKTIAVAAIIAMANRVLATPDELSPIPLPGHAGKWENITPHQAYRLGQAHLLEAVLHATGNYRGFAYRDVDYTVDPPAIPDETRVTYS